MTVAQTAARIGRATANGAHDLATRIRDYRSIGKRRFDKVADHALLWGTGNTAYFLGAERAINQVAQHADNHEGLMMAGAYTVAATGLAALNAKGLPWLSRKLNDYHNSRLTRNVPATALSWVKTLGIPVAIGVATLGYGDKWDSYQNVKGDAVRVVSSFERPELAPPVQLDTTSVKVVEAEPVKPDETKTIIPGNLAGKRMNDLYADLTGVYGVMPSNPRVDYEAQLGNLWARKGRRSDITAVARATGRILVNEYDADKARKMTLNDYIEEANATILDKREAINWDRVKQAYKLNDRELTLTRNIANSLTGCDMMAYAMTELLPSPAGQFNVDVFDSVLRNSGREFLESFPALHDGLTSFGPYQFTQYALNDVTKEGASKMNLTLPLDEKIPGSVAHLRGNDHHAAAYLFAVNNIANLARNTTRSEFETLERVWPEHHDDIVKYIATAHHGPGAAQKIAKRWLSNGAKYDYTVSANGRFINYSRKTDANYNGLGCK